MTWIRSTVKGTPPLGEVRANCVGCLRRFVAGEALVYRSAGVRPPQLRRQPGRCPVTPRTTWTCGSCGMTTDGRSGLADAMDCFCPRCQRCGGLEHDPHGGEECVCDFGHPEPERTCRGCGCTDDDSCDGGCWWVADDLCSACETRPTTPEETPTP